MKVYIDNVPYQARDLESHVLNMAWFSSGAANSMACCHSTGFLGGTLSALAELLFVVLCVLVLTETYPPTRSGIDPRDLWTPTDLERSLAWSLGKAIPDIPTLSTYTISTLSIKSSLQLQSSDLHQENESKVRDSSESSEQAENILLALPAQREGSLANTSDEHANLEPGLDPAEKSPSPTSATIARLMCKFSNCGRIFEHRNEYK